MRDRTRGTEVSGDSGRDVRIDGDRVRARGRLIFLALTTALAVYGNSAGSLFTNLSTRFLAALQ